MTLLASFPAGDPLSLSRADAVADERNATVVYDRDTDDFQVVTNQLPDSQ